VAAVDVAAAAAAAVPVAAVLCLSDPCVAICGAMMQFTA
jgi:hypothetical protein